MAGVKEAPGTPSVTTPTEREMQVGRLRSILELGHTLTNREAVYLLRELAEARATLLAELRERVEAIPYLEGHGRYGAGKNAMRAAVLAILKEKEAQP